MAGQPNIPPLRNMSLIAILGWACEASSTGFPVDIDVLMQCWWAGVCNKQSPSEFFGCKWSWQRGWQRKQKKVAKYFSFGASVHYQCSKQQWCAVFLNVVGSVQHFNLSCMEPGGLQQQDSIVLYCVILQGLIVWPTISAGVGRLTSHETPGLGNVGLLQLDFQEWMAQVKAHEALVPR